MFCKYIYTFTVFYRIILLTTAVFSPQKQQGRFSRILFFILKKSTFGFVSWNISAAQPTHMTSNVMLWTTWEEKAIKVKLNQINTTRAEWHQCKNSNRWIYSLPIQQHLCFIWSKNIREHQTRCWALWYILWRNKWHFILLNLWVITYITVCIH